MTTLQPKPPTAPDVTIPDSAWTAIRHELEHRLQDELDKLVTDTTNRDRSETAVSLLKAEQRIGGLLDRIRHLEALAFNAGVPETDIKSTPDAGPMGKAVDALLVLLAAKDGRLPYGPEVAGYLEMRGWLKDGTFWTDRESKGLKTTDGVVEIQVRADAKPFLFRVKVLESGKGGKGRQR